MERTRRDPVDCSRSRPRRACRISSPLRYARMRVSPFTFYRGAAYLMASDLAGVPRTDLHMQRRSRGRRWGAWTEDLVVVRLT